MLQGPEGAAVAVDGAERWLPCGSRLSATTTALMPVLVQVAPTPPSSSAMASSSAARVGLPLRV